MRFDEYRGLILSDLYRYGGRTDARALLKHYFKTPGFRYSFWLRTCGYLSQSALSRHTLLFVARMFLKHYTFKYGISIHFNTRIGGGFYIGHFGGIVVHPKAVIGRNCNISHGVTIGKAHRGSRQGVPTIGNHVYLGPGAKLIGCIQVGHDVAIGANAVVTKDLPDHSVAVGIPAKVISQQGCDGFLHHTDYPVTDQANP